MMGDLCVDLMTFPELSCSKLPDTVIVAAVRIVKLHNLCEHAALNVKRQMDTNLQLQTLSRLLI